MDFGKMIKNGDLIASYDKAIFSSWEEKKITTAIAISRFKKNNGIDELINIDEGEFTRWLNSLGYFR